MEITEDILVNLNNFRNGMISCIDEMEEQEDTLILLEELNESIADLGIHLMTRTVMNDEINEFCTKISSTCFLIDKIVKGV